MGLKRTDEFRADAVRSTMIARRCTLISSLKASFSDSKNSTATHT